MLSADFLDAGKTTLLKQVMIQQGSRDMRLLVLQIEQGDESLDALSPNMVLHAYCRNNPTS